MIRATFNLDYGDFQLDVDLQLPASGITVLFGHSGSGKTSLLRCIAGLQKTPHGFLSINGNVWQDEKLCLATHQRALGYVFQDANLFAHLSVRDNLTYGLKRLKRPTHGAEFDAICDLLGITSLLSRKPEGLSGGEKQRVAIARALLLKPELLLMDEPLASLDEQRKQDILPYLQRLHQQLNIPVLYVTHSQAEVLQLADYLVLLERGKVLASGTLNDTLNRLDLALASDKLAASVWQVTLTAQDQVYQLSELSFTGGSLFLPFVAAPMGSRFRLQIQARDVSITLEAAQHSSILNILPAHIIEIHHQQGLTLVRLQVGEQTLLAHITRKSAELLQLHSDMAVYVQIKGCSLLGDGVSRKA